MSDSSQLQLPRPSVAATPVAQRVTPSRGTALFLVACLVLALGFQIHTAFNSAPQYLRFARPEQLEYLLPVFWLGFYFVVFPGAAFTQRFGTLPVMAGAGIAAALGALLSVRATSIETLIAGQVIAGGDWGCIMMAAFSAALTFGRTGREGLLLGLLFATLALATFSRMAAAAAQLNKMSDLAPALAWGPVLLWCAGAVVVFGLAAVRTKREAVRA